MNDTIITDNIILLSDTIAHINHSIKLTPTNEDNSQIITNSITIFIALIAALIALYQVKSNIVSSARITWIENLRISLSEYCSEVTNCATIITNMRDDCFSIKDDENHELDKKIEEKVKEYYPSYAESTNKINTLGNKVLLYLNSDESNHKKIELHLSNIYDSLHKDKMKDLDIEKVEEIVREIIKISKLVFKEEWTKSKKIFKI